MEFEKEKKFVIDALGKNHRLARRGVKIPNHTSPFEM